MPRASSSLRHSSCRRDRPPARRPCPPTVRAATPQPRHPRAAAAAASSTHRSSPPRALCLLSRGTPCLLSRGTPCLLSRGTRRITAAQLEGHASTGCAAALAIATNLLRHRRADGGDERCRLLGSARLARHAEVAHEHPADAASAVIPVGPVPAHHSGEAAIELHAPVVDLPVLAGPRGDREARRLRGEETHGAAVVDTAAPLGVTDAERVVGTARGWRGDAFAEMTEVALRRERRVVVRRRWCGTGVGDTSRRGSGGYGGDEQAAKHRIRLRRAE